MSKSATLLLIAVLVFSSVDMFGWVSAQSVTTPSIPEFALSVENDAVVLTIENQPFDVDNSYNYTFYYDVRIKDIVGSWIGLYSAEERPTQSDSSTTVLYYPIEESDLFPNVTTVAGVVIPKFGHARFQVMALIGYLEGSGLVGEVSGWSDSQSIAVASGDVFDPYIYVSPETWDTSYKLVLFSPDDQTIYNDTLPLAFILRWSFVPLPILEPEADYAYCIDDNSFVSIEPNETSKNPRSFSYMIDISNLQEGYHNLVIKSTFHQGTFILDIPSPTFQFIVRTPIPTPTPSATPTPALTPTPSPTPEPTPTFTPNNEPESAEQEAIVGVLVTVAVIGAGLGFLVYLIKRK